MKTGMARSNWFVDVWQWEIDFSDDGG